ncbi:MAG: 3-hydroxyacyl-CoA dehydrogenase NAD-binding domain-containing protein [Alphaproteobacteria bacterium]|nr:3-hydroxyacyl-CoA dehydrogenase NAD-binding domain-containing protein [Alphaproteobacteria bacterium]
MSSRVFQKIAVIGAGTMGSGIAAQIANAGHDVMLFDLPARDGDDKSPAELAIDRLIVSDPPQLMHKRNADRITTGTITDDFDALADCDWIIEAVVERLDIKKDLYRRLDATIGPNCIVSSNTSTIPISLLVEDMPPAFRQRFAITHYFNPVRYMRLLELVRGTETRDDVIDRLADFNDRVLGKGVVRCADTPGFLGNRVGVFALQVGIDEAVRCGLTIEQADALMGRPMGIPKTGVFGLYDLIGIDLMVDVVASLRSILPEGDAFHAVGGENTMITAMIADGFTGNKGRGGFYMTGDGGEQLARPLSGDGETLADWRPASNTLPDSAMRAADAAATRREPLLEIIDGNDDCARFSRRVLGRVLAYAASLVPDVTTSPQDIDDAMKLGFNWQRGPFEMIDAIGASRMAALLDEAGLETPGVLASSDSFYRADGDVLTVRQSDGKFAAVSLPEGVMRFHMTRQTLTPITSNNAASLFALDGDLRLVEFHSKANALTDESMEIVAAAAEDHGKGIIIHNDAQHFSAGVDLNAFRTLIEARDWAGIDAFLKRFQDAVFKLKYTPVPVVGAPSGLAAGGGYEVLTHCDKLVVHTNSVMGLVEAAVGVVPGGGGVKDTYFRWHAAKGNWDDAAWQTWMNLGYAATGSSPQLSARMQYFREGHDETVMNRDRLLPRAIALVGELQDGYAAPAEPLATLASPELHAKMDSFMQEGVSRGDFMPHDRTVAMEIAGIVLRGDGDGATASEHDLYARERRAFINLCQTAETHARIASMLDDGAAIRN